MKRLKAVGFGLLGLLLGAPLLGPLHPAEATVGSSVPGGGIVTSIQLTHIGVFFTVSYPDGSVMGIGPFGGIGVGR